MPTYRWNKLIPNTPSQIEGVWGLWDEGPPGGKNGTLCLAILLPPSRGSPYYRVVLCCLSQASF